MRVDHRHVVGSKESDGNQIAAGTGVHMVGTRTGARGNAVDVATRGIDDAIAGESPALRPFTPCPLATARSPGREPDAVWISFTSPVAASNARIVSVLSVVLRFATQIVPFTSPSRP